MTPSTSDVALKFLSSTTGRDRINRFVQYVCKFLLGYGATKFSKETLQRLQSLMSQATNTRKSDFQVQQKVLEQK